MTHSDDEIVINDDADDVTYDGDVISDSPIKEVNGNDKKDELIERKIKEMEEEAKKLLTLRQQKGPDSPEPEVRPAVTLTGSPGTATSASGPMFGNHEKATHDPDVPEADLRSIYVGNVDYGSTAEELEAHFHGTGSINRVTIMCNKHDGTPKGFAYIEFADKESVQTAKALDDSLFRGRQIKVLEKRANRPGLNVTNRGGGGYSAPRGRSSYRGSSRGGFRGNSFSSYRGSRGRGRSFRGRPYFPY